MGFKKIKGGGKHIGVGGDYRWWGINFLHNMYQEKHLQVKMYLQKTIFNPLKFSWSIIHFYSLFLT